MAELLGRVCHNQPFRAVCVDRAQMVSVEYDESDLVSFLELFSPSINQVSTYNIPWSMPHFVAGSLCMASSRLACCRGWLCHSLKELPLST